MDKTLYKVIVSGHVVEVYTYENPLGYGEHSKKPEKKTDKQETDLTEKDLKTRTLESRKKSNIRARNNIRRLANANFNHDIKFLTLTYKENMQDMDKANNTFKKFIQKLRYRQDNGFKYIAVVEFQKRGAIHYHILLTGFKYMPHKELLELWKVGSVDIRAVTDKGLQLEDVTNIGAYIVKYMTKESANPNLEGKKAYFTSRNLVRPIVVRGDKALNIIESLNLKTRKHQYSNAYDTEYLGLCTYTEYNLKDLLDV